MSGNNTIITDASPAAETINGANSIDLSARTAPIALTLTGNGTHTTQLTLGAANVTVNASSDADAINISGGSGTLSLGTGAGATTIDFSAVTTPTSLILTTPTDTPTSTLATQLILGSALITLDASADANALNVTGGSGALFVQGGRGALTLNNGSGPEYVTGGAGTVGIVANGPVALLPGTGLMTVTNDLAGVTLYGNIAGDGFIQEPALQTQTRAPLTRVTAQFIPSGQSRTVHGSVFGNDNEFTTATAQGAGPTYFVVAGGQVAENEQQPSTFVPYAAGVNGATLTAPATADAPAATAVWNTREVMYDVTIAGQANAAQEGVFLSVDGNLVATVVSGSDGRFSTAVPLGIAAGGHTVTASVYDPAQSTFNDTAASTLTAPPVILAVDGAAAAGVLSATGISAPGATVIIAVDGITQPDSVVADGGGNWTVDLAGSFAPGPHHLVAAVAGVASNSFAEAVASASPTITAVLRNDAAAAGTEFSMTGTADPHATVSIVVDGTPTGQVVVASGTGAWSGDVAGIAAGTHTVTVSAPDANNSGTPLVSAGQSVTVAAPPVLEIPAPIGADLTVSGTTAEAGLVTVTVDGVALPSVSPSGGGFTVTLPTLSAGSHTIVASQDEALTATQGVASEHIVIPTAPTISDTVVAGQLRLAGTAAAGTAVTIHQDNAPDRIVTADGAGHWSVTETIPTALVGATAEIADPYAAGGVLDSAPVTLPVAPVVTGADPSPAAGTAFSAAGTAAPLASVALIVDGATIPVTVTADNTGQWVLDVPGPVRAGSHSVIARVTDPAGDPLVSDAYAASVASRAPTITGPLLSSGAAAGTLFSLAGTADPGATVTLQINNDPSHPVHVTAQADGSWRADIPGSTAATDTVTATTVDANTGATLASGPATITLVAPVVTGAGFVPPSTDLVITGTAAANAVVHLSVDGGGSVAATADGSGHFAADLGAQAAGAHGIVARTADPYGPGSFASAAFGVTVPSAPVILSAIANDQGAVVVTGLADAGATVSVLDGMAVDGTTIAGSSGAWSYTLQAAGAVASVTAIVHPAGYVALNSATVSPPYTSVPPTISGPDPSAPAGALFSLAGHATAHSPLTISLDGATVGTATTDATGAWSYDQTSPVPAGPHVAGVRTTGTPAGLAVTTSVVVASHAPTLSAFSNSAASAGTVLSAHGTADAGAAVTLSANGQALPLAITASAGGIWSADVAGLAGPETLVATTQDANGPGQLASTAVSVAIPAAPVLVYATIATDFAGAETLTVYGTAAAGALVALTDHAGADLGTATTDARGHFGLARAIDPAVFDASTLTASIADPYAPFPVAATIATPYAATPVAPAITSIGPVSPASADAVLVSGTANPGALVTVAIGGTAFSAEARADVDGLWSAALPAPGPGDYPVTASVPGLTGGLGSAAATLHLAPAPVLTGEDTSAAPAGIALELHGTADPNASVAVAVDGSPATTVRANAQGVWVDDIAVIAAGAHAVSLATTDATLGVTLSGSGAFTLTAPVITQASVDGAHFVTVAGTAIAGETVTLASDALGGGLTTTADGNGAWQLGFTAASGAHGLTAYAFDPVRHAQAASVTVTIAVPVALTATPTDPFQLALLAGQSAASGTGLGSALAAIGAAGALRSSLIGAGASGTIAASAGTQLIVNTASAPVTLMGNGGANEIVRNAGGKFTFMTGGGSGEFLDAGSTTDDHFQSPLAGGGSYLVQLGSGHNLVEAKSGDTTIQGGAGSNSIWLGSGPSTVTLAGVGRDTVSTGSGTASVHATGSANELVFAGSGDLTFDNNSGAATVAGSTGSSTIHAWGGSGVFWSGSGGHSEMSANSNCILVSGGDNDRLLAWGHHNELWAVHGNASIQAVGGGDNLLVGGDGNDWMAGFGAGDTLLGGLGNSTLWGGTGDELIHLSEKHSIVYAGNGNETLIAGAGDDQFVFFHRPGVNTYEVQGFRHGLDHVSFADHTVADRTHAVANQAISASGVTLTLGDGTRIVFAGLDRFSAADLG